MNVNSENRRSSGRGRKLRTLLVSICVIFAAALPVHAQPYLSDLSATAEDPLFATYAAPLERSAFIIDEGYRFRFYEPERAPRFGTDHAGNLALAFRRDGDVRYALEEMHSAPVITTSYSDLVKYHFRPYEDVEVEAFFQVYSSSVALQDVRITNTGDESVDLDVYPLLHDDGEVWNVEIDENKRYVTCGHREPLDGWMKRKRGQVPYVPRRLDVLRLSDGADEVGTYDQLRAEGGESTAFMQALSEGSLTNHAPDTARVVAFRKQLALEAGETERMRIARGVRGIHSDREQLLEDSRVLMDYDMSQAVAANEQLYASIPELPASVSDDERMMYWSAFSLIRQCMMPPEGKSSYNYYVFSREPTWGWGYAGQVFHESLTMLSYVFMDPESAMNSQRVYMERQWDNGYIYYRIGSFLEAMNFTRGDFTSSAPWFNWQNWKIYEQTQDRAFLEDAYASGTRFYNWWSGHRDADDDGLMEWGGHAVLESIRDAKVAVWRDVGWPSNFEAPELNGMLVREARALGHMAEALGRTEEAQRWRRKADRRAERVRKTFWDDETDFFYYVDRDDHDFTFEEPNDLKRQSIVGLFALWDGTASEAQAARLVEHLTDTTTFWRPYGVPSLAADDPFYEPRGYWNGPVWVELQFLLTRGLLNYGYEDVARKLAGRVFDNVIYNLKEDHTFWEFYSPESRWAGHHQTYIWAGVVARMMIDLKRNGQLTR
jgi:hypothetical protein